MKTAAPKVVNVRPIHTNGNAYCPILIESESDAAFVSALLAYASTHQLELAYQYARETHPNYHTGAEADS